MKGTTLAQSYQPYHPKSDTILLMRDLPSSVIHQCRMIMPSANIVECANYDTCQTLLKEQWIACFIAPMTRVSYG